MQDPASVQIVIYLGPDACGDLMDYRYGSEVDPCLHRETIVAMLSLLTLHTCPRVLIWSF